jgi:WD40 repeat protein
LPPHEDAPAPEDDPAPPRAQLPEECPAPRLIPAPRPDKLPTWQKGRRLVAQGPVRVLTFAPDSKTLACGASQWVQAWDVEQAKSKFSIVGHASTVTALVYAPDGARLVSLAADGTFRAHDPANGTVNQRIDQPRPKPTAAVLSGDATIMALALPQRIRVREVRADNQLSESPVADGFVTCLAFSPDGDTLAVAGVGVVAMQPPIQVKKGKGKSNGQPRSEEPERWIRLLDPITGTTQRSVTQLKNILCLAFAPDGQTLAAAGQGPTVLIWKTARRKETYELETSSGWVTSLAFSPDGKLLATGGLSGTVEIWDWVAGKRLQTLHGHTTTVLALAFAPDGQTLASGCGDGSVCLWKAVEER